MEYNITWLKIPTGSRQTICSWLFCKHGRGFELGTTQNKIPASCRGRTWTWGLQTTSLLSAAFINILEYFGVQWWEHSPVTSVALQVQVPAVTPCVKWVCSCLSSLPSEIFLWLLLISPFLKNQHFKSLFDLENVSNKKYYLGTIRVQQVYKFFSH